MGVSLQDPVVSITIGSGSGSFAAVRAALDEAVERPTGE
jgi:hypothetical protein